MIKTTRRCEIQINGEWSSIEFKDLKKGMVFRMFEEDGTLVDGDEAVTAISDAYVVDGVDTIQCSGSKAEKAKRDQLAKEVEDWESGKIKPTDPDWKDAPEAVPLQAPVCEDLVDVDLELMHEGYPPRMRRKEYESLIQERLLGGGKR